MIFISILKALTLWVIFPAFHGHSAVYCNSQEDSGLQEYFSAPASQDGLVFQSTAWDDSQLASSTLFLDEFCKAVAKNYFSEKMDHMYYEDLAKTCSLLSFNLGSVMNHFTPTYGPGAATEKSEIDRNLYRDVLRSEEFDTYAGWMIDNIRFIEKSYRAMAVETAKLDKEQLKTDTSVGPLKYGFVYNGSWWGEIISWLRSDAYVDSTFVASLRDLRNYLRKILDMPEESAVEIEFDEEPFSLSGHPKGPMLKTRASNAFAPPYGIDFKSSKWSDSQLASTALFLKAFCEDVTDDKFNGMLSDENMEHVSKVCKRIPGYMEFFIYNFMPRNLSKNPRDILKPEKFKDYASWISTNLPEITTSFINMFYEFLTYEKLGEVLDKYGFVLVKKGDWADLYFQTKYMFFVRHIIMDGKTLQKYLS